MSLLYVCGRVRDSVDHGAERTPILSERALHRSVHRLRNRDTEPVELIEVQSGSYLGEDDIVRLEDVYDRS